MKKTPLASFLVLVGLAFLAPAADEGFQSLFDGKTLSGWHTSVRTGHSATSQHKTAGRWVVEDAGATSRSSTSATAPSGSSASRPGSRPSTRRRS